MVPTVQTPLWSTCMGKLKVKHMTFISQSKQLFSYKNHHFEGNNLLYKHLIKTNTLQGRNGWVKIKGRGAWGYSDSLLGTRDTLHVSTGILQGSCGIIALRIWLKLKQETKHSHHHHHHFQSLQTASHTWLLLSSCSGGKTGCIILREPINFQHLMCTRSH